MRGDGGGAAVGVGGSAIGRANTFERRFKSGKEDGHNI